VKIEQTRENVFTLTATTQELSALVAASRMALDAMRDDPRAPAEALRILERVLADYDRALNREF
jgi:predicted methyltransferase